MVKPKSWVLVLVVGLCVLFAGVALFAAWNGCMTIGLMGNAERAEITNVRFVEGAPSGEMIKVTIKNTGASAVTICYGYANETKASNISPTQPIIPKLCSQELTLTYPNGTLDYETQCQVKLITTKGNTLVISLTIDSTCTSAYDPIVDDIIPTPIPLHGTDLAPELKFTSFQAMVLFATPVVAAFAVVGACLLANYALQPKNRKELFVLLFFVTIIVVFAIIAVVFQILFPPQSIGLM